MTTRREASRSGGFALLVVLGWLGILALLGVLLTSTARVEMRVATATRDHAAAGAAADGAIRQAIFVLVGGGQVGSADQPMRVRIGEATVDITAEDEAGKINPNTASILVLRGLLAEVTFAGAVLTCSRPSAAISCSGPPQATSTTGEARRPAILILVFLSVAGLCHLFSGTMGGVRAGRRSRRYWWQLGEGESEQQVVP